MENTVEMNAPEAVVDGAQAVDAPDAGGEEQVEVNAADLVDASSAAETVEKSSADDLPPKVKNQADFDKALSNRLSQENTKGYNRGKSEVENSPEMQYIRALINDRAREKGITREQALKELNDERIEAKAKHYAENPTSWFRDQMLGKEQEQQAQASIPNGFLSVQEIAMQMADAMRSNSLPEGFDPKNPGDDFFEAAGQYGVKAALRIWKAEHASEVASQADARQIAAEIEKRRSAAKPMSPASPNPATPREVDYMSMNSAQFRELEAKMKQARREGKTVRI